MLWMERPQGSVGTGNGMERGGNPVALDITPGQDADISHAEPMLENIDPDAFLADKAYVADRLTNDTTRNGFLSLQGT